MWVFSNPLNMFGGDNKKTYITWPIVAPRVETTSTSPHRHRKRSYSSCDTRTALDLHRHSNTSVWVEAAGVPGLGSQELLQTCWGSCPEALGWEQGWTQRHSEKREPSERHWGTQAEPSWGYSSAHLFAAPAPQHPHSFFFSLFHLGRGLLHCMLSRWRAEGWLQSWGLDALCLLLTTHVGDPNRLSARTGSVKWCSWEITVQVPGIMVVSFLCPSSRQGQHQISTAFNAKAAKNWRFSHSLCPAVSGELHASHSGARCQFLPCCGSWEEILVLFVPHQLLGAHPAPLCHPCSAKGVSSSQVWYRSVITGISSSKDIFHLLKTSIETRYIIYTWLWSFIMQMYRTSNTSWLPLHRAEHPNLVLELTFFFYP